MRQPSREFLRHLPQIEHLTRAGRTLDLQIVTIVMMKVLERFDQ
jgi:hypothetical protein